MKETDVLICDICKERKAKYKCYICKKDVCGADIRKFRFEIFFKYNLRDTTKEEESDIFVCKDCSHNLTKEPFNPNEEFNKKIMDLIIKYKTIKDL